MLFAKIAKNYIKIDFFFELLTIYLIINIMLKLSISLNRLNIYNKTKKELCYGGTIRTK